MTDPATAAQSFYTRYARIYDLVARHTPGVERLRDRVVDALDPRPGETVVEMGCGTGANLPHLRERIGPGGRVVGLDFAPGALAVARDRTARWENVVVARADARRPPVAAPSMRNHALVSTLPWVLLWPPALFATPTRAGRNRRSCSI